MAQNQVLQISKIDAAHRQLQMAIKMWFHDADPVSTHALAYAAYEVVHDVSNAINPDPNGLLFDSKHIKPEERKEFIHAFKDAANFFKHANRDPDPHGVVSFAPSLTQVLIFFAIHGIELCGEKLAEELLAFRLWIEITNPQIMSKQSCEIVAESGMIEHLESLKVWPKRKFFEQWVKIALKEKKR